MYTSELPSMPVAFDPIATAETVVLHPQLYLPVSANATPDLQGLQAMSRA